MPYRPISYLLMACRPISGSALHAQQSVEAGTARLWLVPQSGDRSPPPAPHREDSALQQAAPSNQWPSDLTFSPNAEPLDAQPLIGRAAASVFVMSEPLKQVVPAERKDNEIPYSLRAALTVRFGGGSTFSFAARELARRAP